MMVAGRIYFRVCFADISRFLGKASQDGLALHEVTYIDDLTITFWIESFRNAQLQALCQKLGAELHRGRQRGAGQLFRKIFARPVLLFGILGLLMLTVWLPQRVLFVRVEGNETISHLEILQAAGECGIYFGASRQMVRSEQLKNNLLDAIPQLRWACVNTVGCTAVITVQERRVQDVLSEEHPSSIYAVRDGVITSGTVISGTARFRIGQAVKAGQLLISGTREATSISCALRAKGEVYALTEQTLTMYIPEISGKKGEAVATATNYSLILGKNLIKLSKDSGILYGGYDKMYTDHYVCLPGGFCLPFAIRVERVVQRTCNHEGGYPEDAVQMGASLADDYIALQSVCATILNRKVVSALPILHVRYQCREMIGRERYEELIWNDE